MAVAANEEAAFAPVGATAMDEGQFEAEPTFMASKFAGLKMALQTYIDTKYKYNGKLSDPCVIEALARYGVSPRYVNGVWAILPLAGTNYR